MSHELLITNFNLSNTNPNFHEEQLDPQKRGEDFQIHYNNPNFSHSLIDIIGEAWVPNNNEFSSGNDNIYSHDGISFKEGRLDERRFLQFQSRSLRTHERNYGPTKLEGLGLSWALASADEIIRNCSDVIVYTDHQALLHIFQHESKSTQQNIILMG